MGRLTQAASDWADAEDPAVLADNFQHHASEAPLSVDWGNGTATRRTFNDSRQLKTLTHGPRPTPISS